MNRIEAVFPLNGELNRYPFDRYETTLWILMTTPSIKKQSKIRISQKAPKGRELQVMRLSARMPYNRASRFRLRLLVCINPGLKFEGNVSRGSSLKVTGVGLKIRRADSVIGILFF